MKTLFERTIQLAKSSGMTVPQICRGTGLRQRWLHRLLDGDFKDPGVNKIQKLYEFLSNKKI